jgi:hypothetical protein
LSSTTTSGRGRDATPLVSVVIPNSNKMGFIEDAIESVLDRTVDSLEPVEKGQPRATVE